jgi:hypothetical protein
MAAEDVQQLIGQYVLGSRHMVGSYSLRETPHRDWADGLVVVEVPMELSCSAEPTISFGEEDLTDRMWPIGN